MKHGLYSGLFFFYFATMGFLSVFWPLHLQGLGYSGFFLGTLIAALHVTKCMSPFLVYFFAQDKLAWVIKAVHLLSLIAVVVMINQSTYMALLLATLVFSFFWTSIINMLDALAVDFKSSRYTRMRLWGSVGFLGMVVFYFLSLGNHISGSPQWMVWFCALAFLLSIFIHAKPKIVKNTAALHKKTHIFFSKHWKMIVAFMLLQGAHGAYYAFFSIDLSKHYSLQAISSFWFLSIVCEIAFFWLLPKYQHKMNFQTWLYVACMASMVRWFATPFLLDNPWWLCALQAGHALTFALSHGLAICWYKNQSNGNLSKAMAIYSASSFGVGVFFGTEISSVLKEVNEWASYLFSAAAATLAFVLCFLSKKSNHSIETLQTHSSQ